MESLKNLTVMFVTFSPWKNGKRLPTNGNVEPVLNFLVPKVRKMVLVDQPYPGSDRLLPSFEIYDEKRVYINNSSFWMYILWPFLKLVNTGVKTHITFKIRDFFSVFDYFLSDQTVFDIVIGLESVNTLAGLVLKKLGLVKKVIYYVSDYSPNRYPEIWFNNIYVWLDRYCAIHADYIWDVSKAIHPARITAGLDPLYSASVLHVPNALYESQIKQAKLSEIKPYSLVFMGTLGVLNGPEIAIESLHYLKKKFPKIRLHMIGGYDDDIVRLKSFTTKHKLADYVIFDGFIDDRDKVSQSIRNFAIALAPYPAVAGSKRFYGDSTKIRAYLAAGLPLITTDVPPLGREAALKGAALLIKDSPKALAEAITKIFSNKSLFLSLRKKSIAFAKKNTWNNELKKAFVSMNYNIPSSDVITH